MRIKQALTASLTLICAMFTTLPALASEPRSKEEIGAIIREFLLENPEILIETHKVLELRQSEKLAQQQKQFIAENRPQLVNTPYQIQFGNPDADKVIVEFFDYNCSFCQRAVADMQQLLESNIKTRFVLKEFPVLGPQSYEASLVSLAFGKLMPDKHAEFHITLLGLKGPKDGNRALELAVKMGADQEKISQLRYSPELKETINEIYRIASGLNISGTPSYVIGEEVVSGAVGYEQIRTVLDRQYGN